MIKSLFFSFVNISGIFFYNESIRKYGDFFKESSNIRYFIRLIFNTIVILLIMFISGILVMYIGTPICLVGIPYILFTVISVVYILLLIYLIKNLFSISFTIKEIVLTSLEEDI